jgi:hypothetical protein
MSGDAMCNAEFLEATVRRATAAARGGLALLLGAWMLSSQAGQTSSTFNVVVNPPGASDSSSERCTMVGTFGRSVTITCTPGAVRFIVPPPETVLNQDVDENITAIGSTTSWRRVRLVNGDYLLEMTVRW